MTDVRIDVRVQQTTSRLKVVWSEAVPFPPYYVDAGVINQVTRKLRERLRILVEDSMRLHNGERYDQANLKGLARLGRDLYDALFLDAGASEIDPGRVKNWFQQRPSARLTI